MLAEKMLAYIGAVVGFVILIFAVDGFFHDFLQGAVFVFREQRVPVGTPNQLNDIPTGAAKI